MVKDDNDFIYLINYALRNKKIPCDKYSQINWLNILKKSKVNNITPLIYYSLDKEYFNYIDKEIVEELKKDTIISGMMYTQICKQSVQIVKEFNKINVSPILLKGLALSNLYPKRELRNMQDLDLLIKKEEFDDAKEKLWENGYKMISGHGGHVEFFKNKNISVELHLPYHFKGNRESENEFWENSTNFNVLGYEICTLSLEDTLVNIYIHMAKHMLTSGFGVKQICDLVLMVEKKGEDIDWKVVNEKIKIYKLERFVEFIMTICSNFFYMKMPNIYCSKTNKVTIKHRIVLKSILQGGVVDSEYKKIMDEIDNKYMNSNLSKKSSFKLWLSVLNLCKSGKVIKVSLWYFKAMIKRKINCICSGV